MTLEDIQRLPWLLWMSVTIVTLEETAITMVTVTMVTLEETVVTMVTLEDTAVSCDVICALVVFILMMSLIKNSSINIFKKLPLAQANRIHVCDDVIRGPHPC